MNKKSNTLAAIMTSEDQDFLQKEAPLKIRGLSHFMEEENLREMEIKTGQEPAETDENIPFKKAKMDEVNEKRIFDRIVYYKRMGSNKEIVPVYIDKIQKEKLDFLLKSPKYKGLSKTAVLSALLSLFLENEEVEVNNEIKKNLERLKERIKNSR